MNKLTPFFGVIKRIYFEGPCISQNLFRGVQVTWITHQPQEGDEMGFLTPGKSSKKRTKEHRAAIVRVKRAKMSLSPPQTRQMTPEVTVAVTKVEEVPLPKEPLRSIIERLPVELIHKVFIHAGLNSLPFVCKSLRDELTPTLSLRAEMIQQYVYDLNTDVPEMSEDYKTRYALDKTVLDYKFVNADALKMVSFDTVLSLETIKAERRNRLVLYYDKLNKKLLDMLKRAESSEDEINAEIERISKERETHGLEDVELSDLALEQVQDYPERLYKGPFDQMRIQLVAELHNRSMKFMDGGRLLRYAISSGCTDTSMLERLLFCTETGSVTDSHPLIAAFEIDDLDLVSWLLTKCQDETAMVNDDDLWIHLSKHQNTKHFHFLEERGGVPSHEILGSIAAGFSAG